MKFGNENQIDFIASEVGGSFAAAPPEAQIELFNSLIDGCREAVKMENVDPKGPLLDFFGVSVKANDLLTRVQTLQLLAKRISRYADPIKQFRVLTYLKPSNWSKGCGWNQIDDARLLLGIYYHGFGNWEKIRLDGSLGLTKKIAPVELQHHETFLPRAPNLRDRATALLEMELAAVGGKNSNVKGGRKASKNVKDNVLNSAQTRENRGGSSAKAKFQANKERPQKLAKAEPLAKEEGEMSDDEEVYEQFKEAKWMEWCEDVMADEIKTLNRLHRLQTTSANLPKEKVLARIRNYLQLIGRRIDGIVFEYEEEPYKQDRMTTRLWNYVSTFSNLSGEKLHQIYSKLRQEQDEEVGPSHLNGSSSGSMGRDGESGYFPPFPNQRGYRNATSYHMPEMANKVHDPVKFEAWKRRRRPETDAYSPGQPPIQQMTNGSRLVDPNSLGILGAAPSDGRRFANKRPYRMHQSSFPQRPDFSSGIK
ncbi:uncharacterized protein J3R85_016074 [Psidium guajava]|nr:uncharacterized protein J3R85_016074 [Psidium guajava]